MIRKTQAFVASDGTVHQTLEEAQMAEIRVLLSPWTLVPEETQSEAVMRMSAGVMTVKDKLLDILTTGPRSRPPARKVNGGSKPRKAKPPVTEATQV